MKIWLLKSDQVHYYTLDLENFNEDYPNYLKNNFNGNKIEKWKSICVIMNRKGDESDTPHLISGVPIVSERAKIVMESFLSDEVQFLPVIYGEKELFAMNVLNIVDCLDVANSEVKRFSDERIYSVDEFSFFEQPLSSQMIFMIPELRGTKVFVTDAFRDKIIASKLKGFIFDEVWSSEPKAQSRESIPLNIIDGTKYSFQEVLTLIKDGMAFVHGTWKVQNNKKNELVIGDLQDDGSYVFMDPIYIPPIFLTIEWFRTEKSEI